MAMSEALPCCRCCSCGHYCERAMSLQNSNCPFLHLLYFLHIFHVLTVNYFRNTIVHSQFLRFVFLLESTAPILRIWVDILDCTVFSKLGWFYFIGFLRSFWWLKNQDEFGTITKICWRKNKSQTTHNKASARLVGVVCTACGKRFANRWAYNQHRTIQYLEETDCYSVQRKQSEMIAIRRGNVSTAVLRSTGALRSGRRKSDEKYGLTCIYIDSSSYFAFFGIFMQNMTNTPWYPRGYQGEVNMQFFSYIAFFVFLI